MAQQSSARTYCQLCIKVDPKNARMARSQITITQPDGQERRIFTCPEHAEESLAPWVNQPGVEVKVTELK